MRTKRLFFALLGVFLFVGAALWWLWPRLPEEVAAPQKRITQPQQPLPVVATNAAPLEKTGMEWHLEQLEKSKWQWKMPISFYGKVVDENGQPVEGAEIHFSWTDLSPAGGSETKITSDGNGLFSLTNIRGKHLGINSVTKTGYYTSLQQSQFSFEYAIKSEANFHRPDPASPVIFHLKKKGEAEPLMHAEPLYGFSIDRVPHYIDLETGKKTVGGSPVGDIAVRVERPSQASNREKYNWSVSFEAMNGGVVETEEEFPFLAPDSGYQPAIELKYDANDPKWKNYVEKKFYLKSRGGKLYARIKVGIYPLYQNASAIRFEYFANPSGSRNLEFDPEKQINK